MSCLVSEAGYGYAFAGMFIAVVYGFIISSALAKMRESSQRELCLKNSSKLASAVWLYAKEHNHQFPPAKSWCDAINAHVSSDKGFKCPAGDSKKPCHYAFNSKLDGLITTNVDPKTVMLFETIGGWNVNGGKELMIQV
ncbi:MAG: hypothetical protein M3Y82_06405, partial [Verrucomicrobiota bacterium]|nr:hypothetical protein [Verrucomicrobiota bacterium]